MEQGRRSTAFDQSKSGFVPRACGEYGEHEHLALVAAGSSPRLRGTRDHQGVDNGPGRFIPAPAGNTLQRGGHLTLRRFIPAPAGNTSRWNGRLSTAPVHPRACGEHFQVERKAFHCSGSSPRLRGTLRKSLRSTLAKRFIPAPAGNTPRTSGTCNIPPVHPRACGEHAHADMEAPAGRGSSPRLRGTPTPSRVVAPGHRFIPAPAGNTSGDSFHCVIGPVHPRACGEHAPARKSAQSRRGSSPRLRGTRHRSRGKRLGCRFIPAPAGNTMGLVSFLLGDPVHPRACGEHISRPATTRPTLGSSPRLRGTRRSRAPLLQKSRFIPAPAGNTARRRSAGLCYSVHPRACGEHGPGGAPAIHPAGSSPRLRGTPAPPAPPRATGRFIPAPAGNTSPRPPGLPRTPVRPRACGEHWRRLPHAHSRTGSSPRLRGTRHRQGRRGLRKRFIPAPAGNTWSRPTARGDTSVHPRACGEHAAIHAAVTPVTGSSPRLRGTRIRPDLACRRQRFIPAPAGNTPAPPARSSPQTVHPRACGEHYIKRYIRLRRPGSSPRLRGTPRCC